MDLAKKLGVHGRDDHAARRRNSTSSTRCSVTAAAVSASPIRRSPRCRPAPSSKPPPTWPRRSIKVKPEVMIPLVGFKQGARPPGRDRPPRRQGSHGREEGEVQLPGRHHDRSPARRADRRRDRRDAPSSSASAPTTSPRPRSASAATTWATSSLPYTENEIFKKNPFATLDTDRRRPAHGDRRRQGPQAPARTSSSASAANTAAIRTP